jgi:mono/diheme cytochrome c family protein
MKHIAIFLVFVALIVGLLFTLSGNKSPRIPNDEYHVVFDAEEVCRGCHGPEGDAPRKETHPPKDQCLECHKVKDNRRRAADGE